MIRIIPITSTEEIHSLIKILKESQITDIWLWNMLIEPDEFIEKPLDFYLSNRTFTDYYLCLKGESIIGYARLGLTYSWKKRMRHRYSLWPFYITPKFRWYGYGVIFLDLIISAIIEHSAERYISIILQVNTENVWAIKTYERCNFHIIGKEISHLKLWENFTDCYIMQRIIEKSK